MTWSAGNVMEGGGADCPGQEVGGSRNLPASWSGWCVSSPGGWIREHPSPPGEAGPLGEQRSLAFGGQLGIPGSCALTQLEGGAALELVRLSTKLSRCFFVRLLYLFIYFKW